MVSAPHAPAPRGDRPTHVADLLRLVTRDPGRPRLTWYGDDGERVELSGAVLENWVNKTTNLLVEEFDAGPRTQVVLDLPVHWRTVVWAFAAWRVGATVVLTDENATGASTPHADVVVTDRPDRWTASGAELVAVALPALARAFDGALPAGAIDAASAVMTYGDQVGWVPQVEPAAPAWVSGAGSAAHEELVPRTGTAPGARTLVAPGAGSATLGACLAVLADDGSVVLISPRYARRLRTDEDAARRLATGERIDAEAHVDRDAPQPDRPRSPTTST